MPLCLPSDEDNLIQLVILSGRNFATGLWSWPQVWEQKTAHPAILPNEFRMGYGISDHGSSYVMWWPFSGVQGSPHIHPAACSPIPACYPHPYPADKPQSRARGKQSAHPPCPAQLVALKRQSLRVPCQDRELSAHTGHFSTCECVCEHAKRSWPVNHCQHSHILGHSSGTNQ